MQSGQANKILFFNTLAFTFCFAAWMLNGILVTFLVDNQLFNWSAIQVGWLIGIPVLTGAVLRLPAGILTDRYGGKPVFTGLLLLCAVPLFLLSYADDFWSYALCSLGFGLAGTSFAIGIAFSSVWFPKEKQGTALGIFGAGNAGAAITTLVGPSILDFLTDDKTNLEGWRLMPQIYAAFLIVMALVFLATTTNKKPAGGSKNLTTLLRPLKSIRVWRFGLYYFLVFGCFVSFAGWLVPYYTNMYGFDLATAGFLASCFSLPSGIVRAYGGWLSDKFGARAIMYRVLGGTMLLSLALLLPKMDIYSTGKGVMAKRSGKITAVTPAYVELNGERYDLIQKTNRLDNAENEFYFWPAKEMWQESIVKVGDEIGKKELLAEGKTHIYFQANVWVFASLAILLGSIWGIGKAAVYKHIPDYFPNEVGVVGGMVGVLGGLGGFICPIVFGYLLEGTGLWSSCWILMLLLSIICLGWMHSVVQKMNDKASPTLMTSFEVAKN